MYDDKLIRIQDKFQIIAECLNLMPYSKSHKKIKKKIVKEIIKKCEFFKENDYC